MNYTVIELGKMYLSQLHEIVPLTQMNEFRHHGNITTYQHSLYVVAMCLRLADKFSMKVDVKTLVYGVMLHDFFGYDYREVKKAKLFNHGKEHPSISIERSAKYIELNDHAKAMIASHMWPKNFTTFPNSKEAWLLCFADKICAVRESAGWVKGFDEKLVEVI